MKLFTQILVLIKFYQIVFGSDQQNKLNMSYIESYPVAGRAPDGNRDPYFCHDIKKFNMKKEFMGFCICEKWDPLTLGLNGFPMGKRDCCYHFDRNYNFDKLVIDLISNFIQ